MLAYFLKVNVAITLFYAFYRLFFYKDTFFGWRRTVLFCFFGVSATVPLLNIQTWITAQEPMVAMADLYANVVLPEFTIGVEAAATDWKSTLLKYAGFTYWGVVACLVMRFIIQLTSIIRLACRCRKVQAGNTSIYLLPKADRPFSFFHWIFIHPSLHTKEEFSEILTHEQTHARQWHSIDVIISELACILCWFNPFAWLMKREVRTNLEYMADARVLEHGYDSKAYQYHLLGLSQPKAAATIYNSFNVLPLKKRIKMMNKERTREIGRAKYLMFLPLAALLLIISNIDSVAHTTKKIAAEVIEAVETSQAVEQVLNVLDVPEAKPTVIAEDSLINQDAVFEVVEEMPQFSNNGMPGLMDYLSKNIRYPEAAKKKGTQGRVTTSFIVEKDGRISNVKILRSVDLELDKEAIRVISDMPKWKPGMQRGKAVRVKFTLPIAFHLPEGRTQAQQAAALKKDAAKHRPTMVTSTGEEVFEVVETMPQFPGGIGALIEFINKNIKYPEAAQKTGTQGRATIQFTVDKEGNVVNPKVIRGVDPSLDAEAIRMTTIMPKWTPGMQKGKAVNVKYTVPVVFRLPEKQKADNATAT